MNGLTVSGPFEPISSVYPSGAEVATTPAPRLPPAPARFSTTMLWPSVGDMLSERSRPTRSALPPGANGTISRIGRSG